MYLIIPNIQKLLSSTPDNLGIRPIIFTAVFIKLISVIFISNDEFGELCRRPTMISISSTLNPSVFLLALDEFESKEKLGQDLILREYQWIGFRAFAVWLVLSEVCAFLWANIYQPIHEN